MLVKRLEVEGGGTAEEDSPLPANHNNLLHTQALESRSSHPTLWGKGVIVDLHPTDPFPFGESGRTSCGKGRTENVCVAAALKMWHSVLLEVFIDKLESLQGWSQQPKS